MTQKQKPFTPYPTRPIRMSDKTWNELKKQKLKTGKNWDKFLEKLLVKADNKNGRKNLATL